MRWALAISWCAMQWALPASLHAPSEHGHDAAHACGHRHGGLHVHLAGAGHAEAQRQGKRQVPAERPCGIVDLALAAWDVAKPEAARFAAPAQSLAVPFGGADFRAAWYAAPALAATPLRPPIPRTQLYLLNLSLRC